MAARALPVAAAGTNTLRLVAGIADAIASVALGRPADVRVALSPRSLRAGRAERVAATVDHAEVVGLAIARLRVDARWVALVPGWPPRLQARVVRVHATVTQGSLDRWLLPSGLPLRVRFRNDGLAVRAGVGGLRLGEARAGIAVDGGRLVVIPRRAEVLGWGLAAPPVRVVLPLPPLPRGTRVTEFAVTGGEVTLGLEVPDVDEPVDLALLRRLRRRAG